MPVELPFDWKTPLHRKEQKPTERSLVALGYEESNQRHSPLSRRKGSWGIPTSSFCLVCWKAGRAREGVQTLQVGLEPVQGPLLAQPLPWSCEPTPSSVLQTTLWLLRVCDAEGVKKKFINSIHFCLAIPFKKQHCWLILIFSYNWFWRLLLKN